MGWSRFIGPALKDLREVTRPENPSPVRNSAVWLLVALGLLFLSAPFVQDLRFGSLIEACLLTLVMTFAVLAVGARGRTLGMSLLLVIPALAARWINYLRPDLLSPVVFLLAAMLFFAFVVAHILRFILRTPRVDANVLCAGLSGYLILGMLWVPAYLLVATINPGAFIISGERMRTPAWMDSAPSISVSSRSARWATAMSCRRRKWRRCLRSRKQSPVCSTSLC